MKKISLLTPEGRAQAIAYNQKLEAKGKKIEFGGEMSAAAAAVSHLKPGKYSGTFTGEYGVHEYAQTYSGVDGKYKMVVKMQDGQFIYPNMPEALWEVCMSGNAKAMPVTVIVRESEIDGRIQKFAQIEGQDWGDSTTTNALTPPEQLTVAP